jgi:regulator of protease activity HflC (stomatin/prohibitin superfamily)
MYRKRAKESETDMLKRLTNITGANSMSKSNIRISAVGIFVLVVFILAAVFGYQLLERNGVSPTYADIYLVVLLLIGVYLFFAIKVAAQWEKAVILRFGKFHSLKGPGFFWIIPIVDSVVNWIDHRVNVTPFSAEKTLTKDTVPVDVDAVLFWLVWDAQKAALEVADYWMAISWAAQTALREIIGQMTLADILVGRAMMDAELQKIID